MRERCYVGMTVFICMAREGKEGVGGGVNCIFLFCFSLHYLKHLQATGSTLTHISSNDIAIRGQKL